MSFLWAVKVSREEEGDEGEYAVVRALGFKARPHIHPVLSFRGYAA